MLVLIFILFLQSKLLILKKNQIQVMLKLKFFPGVIYTQKI